MCEWEWEWVCVTVPGEAVEQKEGAQSCKLCWQRQSGRSVSQTQQLLRTTRGICWWRTRGDFDPHTCSRVNRRQQTGRRASTLSLTSSTRWESDSLIPELFLSLQINCGLSSDLTDIIAQITRSLNTLQCYFSLSYSSRARAREGTSLLHEVRWCLKLLLQTRRLTSSALLKPFTLQPRWEEEN